MRILKILLIIIFLVFVTSNCFIEENGFAEVVKEEKSLTFKGVDQFRLANVTGDIEVRGWDNEHLEVSYLKKASSDSLLEKLRVLPSQEDRVLDIDTDYPRKCKRCSISFRVYVPRSMEKIALRTVTGAVKLGDMDHVNELTAKTVTGSVKVELSVRNCTLSSVTGGIRGVFKKIDGDGEIEASLTTGSVRFFLPDDFAGRVSLKTVTGSVHTDFPVTMTGVLKKNRIVGSIGEGSRRIQAQTVTGSIHLLRK